MTDQIAEIEAALAKLPGDAANVRERVDLLNSLGWELRERFDAQRILKLSEEAMDLAQTHSYQPGLLGAFRNAAFAHYMLASFRVALAEALVALHMAEELNDRANQANALSTVALVHWSLGNYDEALQEAFRGLKIVEGDKDAWGMAWGYTIIGGIYQSLRDYEQALHYHERSHKLFSSQNYPLGEGRSLTGLGTVYLALGDLDAALEYHQRSLELYRSIGNSVGESRALNDIGEIHQRRGDLDAALDLHRQSLRIREHTGQRQAQVTSLLNLGSIHLARKECENARELLERALAIAREIGARPKLSQAHELLASLCEQAGDPSQALAHHKEFHRIKQEVFNEEESTKLKNLQIGLEVERSRQEAQIHRLKNVELKEKNDQLARLLNELQETQAQLVQSEKMGALGDLVAAITHEINTPLGAIQSSADVAVRAADRVMELIDASQSIDQLRSSRSLQGAIAALRKNGQAVASASKRIGKLISSLKSFARVDQAEFQEFDLTQSLEDTLTLLEPSFRGRIRVAKDYGRLPRIYGYPAEINQVFMNLLRNAAEAIDGDGVITISTSTDNGFVIIRVADSGRGIPADQIPRLFNPGFHIEGSSVRASMSLFTSLNIVRKHRGDIRVESEVGKGSTFTIRLGQLPPVQLPA